MLRYTWELEPQEIYDEWEDHHYVDTDITNLRVMNTQTGMQYPIEIDQDEINKELFPLMFTETETQTLYRLMCFLPFEKAIQCLSSIKFNVVDEWIFEDSFSSTLSIINNKSFTGTTMGKILTQQGFSECIVFEQHDDLFLCVNLDNYSYFDTNFDKKEMVPVYTKMLVPANKLSF